VPCCLNLVSKLKLVEEAFASSTPQPVKFSDYPCLCSAGRDQVENSKAPVLICVEH